MSAASLGLQALALNRETFRDQDSTCASDYDKRHDLVNVVPDEAVIETLVRGKTLNLADASQKTDRSFKAVPMLWEPDIG